MKDGKRPRASRLLPAAGLGLAMALTAFPAHAELGGTYYSVLQDQAEMHANMTTQENPSYTTYILDMPDGTQVREYLSQHTGVFAIDWSGDGRRPNMRQVLGIYFDRFSRPANTPRRGHNNAVRRTDPDFVFESRVAMRHFSGRAYLPQYVPQEVAIADVR
jgi:hypothetical protein